MGVFFKSLFSVTDVTLPGGVVRFVAGFTGSVTTICVVCLFFAAANFLYSAVSLHHDMVLRMVSAVRNWSTLKHTLELGCSHEILLNAVATQLKKEGSSGRVVGLDRNKTMTVKTLCIVKIEGVGEYVTCKEGDVRSLLFGDNYFDVVVSGVFVHMVGKEYGKRTVEAAAERTRGRCRNNFFYFSIVDLKKKKFLYLFLSINFFRNFCLTWNFIFY